MNHLDKILEQLVVDKITEDIENGKDIEFSMKIIESTADENGAFDLKLKIDCDGGHLAYMFKQLFDDDPKLFDIIKKIVTAYEMMNQNE